MFEGRPHVTSRCRRGKYWVMRERDDRWNDVPDAALLAASVEAPEAFGQFYDRHVAAILAFFYRRTASAQDAADLTAETFAKALSSRRRYKQTEAPGRAWLFGIAGHELSKYRRRGRTEDKYRRRLGIPAVAMNDESLERVEALVDFEPLRGELRRAMNSLSPSIAEALVLRVGLDMSFEEVARRLNCSQGAARVRVSRGLSQLAELME